MGARAFEAYAERDYAAMLVRRAEPGDRADAEARSQRAQRIARDIELVL